ncbi:MAG TPA: GAF domain-containing protein, partial [Phototrophicaceae bacterium]|nr:GAF domain-containing protein [Phototrophicaceae bacterium]
QLGAATEDKTSTQTLTILTDESMYRDALAYRQPVFDSKRKVWISPLNSEITTFGVMEIPVSNETQDNQDERRDWIMLLGEYLGQALDTRKLQDLARVQAQTSSHLTEAASYSDIAGILAKHLLKDRQFISVNVFDFDDAGMMVGFRVAVTANRKQVFGGEEEGRVEINLATMAYPMNRIMDEARPYLISQVATHPSVDPGLKTWLESHNVEAVCIFPMRSQGKTFGFIALNSVQGPLYTTESELSIYQSLVDQVSTLIRLGRVFEQADYTLAISERQKQAFNELVAGQDYSDMVGIIARHMLPEGGRYLGIAELIYDANNNLTEWHIMATANRKTSYRWKDEETPVPFHELAPVFRNNIRDGEVLIVEDNGTDMVFSQIGEGMVNWLRRDHTRTYASFPIMLNERPIALLLAMSRNERAFTREEINAFSNIAGQMGVLVQVRYLLNQARTARNLVDNLVLANRLVMVAGDYGYMAQSITYTVARTMIAAVVTLFDRPLQSNGKPQHRHLVGMSTAEDIIQVDPNTKFADTPDDSMMNRLRAGQAVIAEDLTNPATAAYFSPETQLLYTGIGAVWSASFGLRSGDFLIGTLDILSDKSQSLSNEEIDTYTTLADQIGVTIRSRQLNNLSEEAQAVAARLVQTNLQVSTAENFTEMAQAVT